MVSTLSFTIPLAAYLCVMHNDLHLSTCNEHNGEMVLCRFTGIIFFVFEHILPSSPKIRISFVVGLHQYPPLFWSGMMSGYSLLGSQTHFLRTLDPVLKQFVHHLVLEVVFAVHLVLQHVGEHYAPVLRLRDVRH